MNRRHLLNIAALSPLALLPACGTGQAATDLATAKVWVAAVANAMSAASAAYTGPNSGQIKMAVVDVQAAAAAFQSLGDVSTARSAATSFLAMAQQLVPLLTPVLRQNAAYVSMGIAIVQTFVAALPPPPNAPAAPPASMVGR